MGPGGASVRTVVGLAPGSGPVAGFGGGLKGLVHRLSVRWAWLAAGRAKGGGDGTVAGVAAGVGVGVVDRGVLVARDRARGRDGEGQRDRVCCWVWGRATGAARARRSVSVVGGARGDFAGLGAW